MRIGEREVGTLYNSTEPRHFSLTNCGVMELEPAAPVTAICAELDENNVLGCLDHPRTLPSLTVFPQWRPPDCPAAVVDLDVIIATGGALLQVEVRDDEVDPAAAAHQDPPAALCVVAVRLGVVGGADTAGGSCEVSATTWVRAQWIEGLSLLIREFCWKFYWPVAVPSQNILNPLP